MAAYQIAQFPAVAPAVVPAVAPVAAPAGGRIPTWVGIVPGCYEAAILVEAVLRGELTAATRNNTGDTDVTPDSGMVFVYKRHPDTMERFTVKGIKFSPTRVVNAGNAVVSIAVERNPGQRRLYEPKVTYSSTADLQLAVDAPESLDLASVKWDQSTAAGDWLRQTVGDNTAHFPVSIRGGLVKKVFTVTVAGAGVYTVVSLYTLRDAWPGRMQVPSGVFPVVPRQTVHDGFKNTEDFGPVDTVVYNMQQGPVNCMAYAQAAAAVAAGFLAPAPPPAAAAAAGFPAPAPAPAAAAALGVPAPAPAAVGPQQPPAIDVDADIVDVDAHFASMEAYEAECRDACDLEKFHSFMYEEIHEAFFASMLGDVQGGSDEDVAMTDLDEGIDWTEAFAMDEGMG